MKTDTLCMGCMADKGVNGVCPQCKYREEDNRSPLVLPYRTILNEKFLIGKVLGKPGGFGITYLGWDLILQTTAAIKEYLPREFAARDRDGTTVVPFSQEDKQTFSYGLAQFLQEAQTLVTLNHPNVIRIREFFRANNTAYLVMDYCKGVSLEEYLYRKGGKLPENVALKIMLPVLAGLNEVHRKGFLHRDIKPNNIYLTQENKVVLLDFGAARVAMGEHSKSLSVVLTPGFAPYEQYHSRGKQGPWTDIYACGATLYYLLTGIKPVDAIARYQHDDLVPPERLIPGLSAPVNQAILHALAVEAAARPQSIQDFQRVLLAKSKEPPPPPPDEQTVLQSPTLPRPQPLPKTSAPIQFRTQAPPRPSAPAPVTKSSGKRNTLLPAAIAAAIFLISFGAYFTWRAAAPKPLPPPATVATARPAATLPAATPTPALQAQTPASLPPLSLQGKLLFDGQPITDFTNLAPRFWFRNEDTGQALSSSPLLRYEKGAFFVYGLPPAGNFGVSVDIDANPQNAVGYPGDFSSGERFSLPAGANPELLLNLKKIMHLSSPQDNGMAMVGWDAECMAKAPLTSPVTFRWEPVIENVSYAYRITRLACLNHYNPVGIVTEETISPTEATVNLPPSPDNECYGFVVSALKDGRSIGQLTTHGMKGGLGWDYRFRVSAPRASQAAPLQNRPAQPESPQATPSRSGPTQDRPSQTVPSQVTPSQPGPTQDRPSQPVPPQGTPSRPGPTLDRPSQPGAPPGGPPPGNFQPSPR